MKKFLFFVILLAALGGTIFFLGWAQLTVPTGAYGVIRSKTHGLDSQIVRDGEFRWIWYKLIPTNAKTSVFTIVPLKRTIKKSGALFSGQIYAAHAGLETDFSWEMTGEISFSLKPEHLPEFTARENVSDDDALRQAEQTLAVRVENLVLEKISAFANNESVEKIESLVLKSSIPGLSNDIEAMMPEIENFNCVIQLIRIPDYSLYRAVRELYHDFIKRQSAVLSLDIAQEAEKRISSRVRMEELSQYGELLTKYPILIQYLTIEKDLKKD
jgi:hypothetical protein